MKQFRNNALYAAAETALPSSDSKLFKAALKKIRRLGKIRNQLAHGVIIQSAALSDGFAIAEQRQFAEMTKIFFTPPRVGETRQEQVQRLSTNLMRALTVFRKDDLARALGDIEAASSLAVNLSVLAAPIHHNKDDARAKLVEAVGEDGPNS